VLIFNVHAFISANDLIHVEASGVLGVIGVALQRLLNIRLKDGLRDDGLGLLIAGHGSLVLDVSW